MISLLLSFQLTLSLPSAGFPVVQPNSFVLAVRSRLVNGVLFCLHLAQCIEVRNNDEICGKCQISVLNVWPFHVKFHCQHYINKNVINQAFSCLQNEIKWFRIRLLCLSTCEYHSKLNVLRIVKSWLFLFSGKWSIYFLLH